jgi:hypothetical protein
MSTLPTPELAVQPESSAVSRMTGVIFAPTKTFTEIARRPMWVAPFVIISLLSIVVSSLIAQKTDWRGFFERQMSKNPRTEQMPQEQKDRIMEGQVKYAPKIAFVFGLIITAFMMLLLTLVYWGAFNLFTGAGLGFKTSFGIVTHACVPWIISSILAIIILLIKRSGDVDPEHFLASNAAAFLPDDAPHWLESLGQSIELFWMWALALIAIGFSAASPKKIKPAGAFLTVFGIWVAWVMGKVAWAMF